MTSQPMQAYLNTISAVTVVMLVEHDAGMQAADEFPKLDLAPLDGPAAYVLAVQLDQIEGTHSTAAPPWLRLETRSNTARPLSSVTIASPSSRNGRPGGAATAAAASGKRWVKSLPLRVEQPHAGTIAAGHDAEAVVLNLVNPVRPSRWALGRGR
jgi:hypothetical protein